MEYLDDEGELWKIDLSCGGDGNDLATSKQLELAEWARMMTIAPIISDMVGSYLFGDEEDGGEEEISEVTV